uniref:ShKT domain-containing protein n=1 Tax=Panagrolaimus sp. JU765 TaxID=591449 RepID=A0AC34Q4Y7_9BILA
MNKLFCFLFIALASAKLDFGQELREEYTCPANCVDTWGDCKDYAQFCQDPKKGSVIRAKCPCTCQVCGPTPTSGAATPQSVSTASQSTASQSTASQSTATTASSTLSLSSQSTNSSPASTSGSSPSSTMTSQSVTPSTSMSVSSTTGTQTSSTAISSTNSPSSSMFLTTRMSSTTTVTPLPPNVCADANPECANLYTNCELPAYKTLMCEYCRKTCNFCEDPCAGLPKKFFYFH